MVQPYDAAGEALGEPIAMVGEAGAAEVRAVSIDTMPDGGFVAAFVQNLETGTTLYASRFNAAGVADDTGPIALDTGHTVPLIAADGNNGHAVVAYVETADTNTYFRQGELHYRRVTPAVAAIDKRQLYVLGTNSADSVTVSRKALSVVVTQGDTLRRFDATAVDALGIHGYDGDDSSTTPPNFPPP